VHVREFDQGDQEGSCVGTKKLIMLRADNHRQLSNLQGSGNRIWRKLHSTALPILLVSGEGGLMRHKDLTTDCRSILLDGGNSRIGDGGGHRGRRGRTKHQ